MLIKPAISSNLFSSARLHSLAAQIPLPPPTLESVQTDGNKTPEKFVEPYLAQDLHWRMVNRNAQLTPRDQINGLLIVVVTCEVTVPTVTDAFPQNAAKLVPRPAATTRKQEDWSDNQPGERGDGTAFTGGNVPVLTSFDHYPPLVSDL